MMRLHKTMLLLLLATHAAGCAQDSESVLAGESPLINTPENPMGNLSVLTPIDPADKPVKIIGAWTPVVGLSSGVLSRAGDSLEIQVSARIQSNASVRLRAVVDGRATTPAKWHGTGDNTHSYTFVAPNVGAGQHIVEIQAYVPKGSSATMRARTLAVHSAAPDWGTARLAVSSSSSPLAKTDIPWADVGLVASINTPAKQNLAIAVSAVSSSTRGRMFMRAVLDGSVVGDVTWQHADMVDGEGARRFTFVAPDVPAGNHQVRIQWGSDTTDADLHLGARTLAVTSAPLLDDGGAALSTAVQGPPESFGPLLWRDIPGLALDLVTQPADSTLAVDFSGEVRTAGPASLQLRALLDGRVLPQGDIVLESGEDQLGVIAHTFVLKNLLPGFHRVTLQARTASVFTTGYIRDRSLRIESKRRTGSDFVQAFPHYGFGQRLAPLYRGHDLLVLCIDPRRPGVSPPSLAQIRAQVEGSDGDLSLRGWFADIGNGHLNLDSFRYVNCGPMAAAPVAHQGTWYWDTQGGHDQAFRDAVQLAAGEVDFPAYDRNGDGFLSHDEVAIMVVRPQLSPYGTFRHGDTVVDGKALNFELLDIFLSPNDAERRSAVGVMAHEGSHMLVGAGDAYGCDDKPTAPVYDDIMDAHWQASHLGPFEKIKSGFVTPDLIEVSAWTTGSFSLPSVENGKEVTIVHDARRGDAEYFVIENRYGPGDVYDSPRLAKVILWHFIEDPALAEAHPPLGAEACSTTVKAMRKEARPAHAGNQVELVWADGTSSGLTLRLDSEPGENTEVQLIKSP